MLAASLLAHLDAGLMLQGRHENGQYIWSGTQDQVRQAMKLTAAYLCLGFRVRHLA